jgi:hypothetical protein
MLKPVLSSLFQPLLERPDGSLRACLKVGLFAAVNGGTLALVEIMLRNTPLPGLDPWLLWLALTAAATLGVSWLFLFLEGRPLHSIGLRPSKSWGLHFAAGAAGGGLLMLLVACFVRGFDGFHWVRALGGTAALVSGAWLFLVVALREELLFRGYAFQRLADGTGDWPALVLGAGYFAYAHWGNPGMAGATRLWASLNIGLAGILLGLGYLKTRSLALSVGLHLGWNWTQGSLLGFGVSGTAMGSLWEPVFHQRPTWLTGGAFGLEASLPCTLFTVLGIVALARWHPASGNLGGAESPEEQGLS